MNFNNWGILLKRSLIMVKLDIRIIQDEKAPLDLAFRASCEGDSIYAGYGATPYEALYDLINEFKEHDVWRADNE